MVPAASHRTELLLGVGGARALQGAGTGALRSGPYKLIAPARQADGWSAQYAGSTPYIAAIPGAGTCVTKPCLFDLEADPLETKDLSVEQPALTTKLFERYKTLAKEMYAPNMPTDRMTGDAGLDAVLECPEACSDDDCWERKSHALQLRLDAAEPTVNCSQLSQIISADWYLGTEDVFAFTATEGRLALSIVKGCQACKFTKGDGTLVGGKIDLVAFGKGANYTHSGAVSANKDGSCRVHWGDNWRDFCQGKPCVGPEPGPGPPAGGGPACEAMLAKGGFWQPYVATPGWPL